MGSTVVAFGVIGRSVVQQFGDVVQRPIVVEDADFAPFARTLVVDGVGVFGDSSTARTGITSSQLSISNEISIRSSFSYHWDSLLMSWLLVIINNINKYLII